jgi:hypothetical protein
MRLDDYVYLIVSDQIGLTTRQITARMKRGNKDSIRNAITRLVKSGKIRSEGDWPRRHYFKVTK